MKNLSRRLIAAGLAALLLGACATGRSAPAPRSGQPNFRSIYYFLVGTYHQNGADHATADALLRKAAAEDPRAQTISRQLLLNAIGRWQREDLSSAALRRELLAYQRDFGLDEELLHAAADLHEEEGDLPAAAACLNRLRELYPSARADLRLFVHGLRAGNEPKLELLEAARIKADDDPPTLRMLAGIWFHYDPLREKEALLRAHELEPDEGSYAYLADYSVRNGDLELARRYFSELSWPADRERMLYLAGSDWVTERNPLLVELAPTLLATGDLELINPLAFAALMENRPELLEGIAAALDTLSAPDRDKQDLHAMLIAQALLQPEGEISPRSVARLGESGYFDAIVSYYICGLTSRPPESWELEDPAAWPAFQAELDRRFPPGPAAGYLNAFVQTIRDSAYAGLIDAKHALILNLRESHNLSEDDYSFLMSYYQLNRREDLYLDILAEALRQWPDNPNYCNDMGYRMLLAGEDPESAAALIRHALVFEPDNIYFLDSLAWYHYLVGEFEEALRLMDLPQRQDELPAEIAWHIGAIYLALEDYADARVWLQKCLDTGNDPAAEQEAREALELLP